MSNELVSYEEGNVITHGDDIVAIAAQAEARVSAVIKIKQTALMVTNGGDWVDQDGKPYLMASGAEKIANLFNVSWRFLTPEPVKITDPDGHYTYTYSAEFRMGSRTIEVEGSRSSKDGFFRQYDYYGEGSSKTRTEKPIHERNNERDVKMAALTNLLGNGITRLLGIRNLSYADLEQFAGITKEMMGKVDYKKKDAKPPIQQPQEKKTAAPATPPATGSGDIVTGVIETVTIKEGSGKKGPWTKYGIKIGAEWYGTFDTKIGEAAHAAKGQEVSIRFSDDGKYKTCEELITAVGGGTPGGIPDDCPGNPDNCEYSSFDGEGKAFCGPTESACAAQAAEKLPL